MTVKVSKPAINVREELADLRKPTGLAGEAMLRAETPQEQFNLIGAGRRNLLINGENKISQRGDYTSATAIADNTYYIDRWKSFKSGVAVTLTHKEDRSLPDGSVSRTQRYNVTTGATGHFGARQIIEEPLMAGRVYTLSAWVKSNNADMNLYSENGDYRKHHSGSGEWEKLSLTFIATGLSNRDYGLINYTAAGAQPTAAGDFVEFTQFQLELGKVATPFEHRSYGEELAACQRYYYRLTGDGGSDTIGTAAIYSATQAVTNVYFPVTMRTIPTLSVTSGTNAFRLWVAGTNYQNDGDDVGNQDASEHAAMIFWNGFTGLTAGQAGWVRLSSGGSVAYDAEL
jgi:hypothetical protein